MRKPDIEDEFLLSSDSNIQKLNFCPTVFIDGINPILNQLYICSLNYLLLGCLNYAVIGYSDETTLLRWMNILGLISGSIGRLSSTYIRFYRISLLSFIQTFPWFFLFIMCFIGKVNILPSFGWIVVIVNTFYAFIFGYTDTVIYLKVTQEMHQQRIEQISRFVGLANQLGAFAGSLISFILVITAVLHT